MYTGKGIGVAVLDTGIFPHIDFGSRISVFRDFTGVRRSPYDDNGHGTHVSGILAGDGTASGGKYKGAAPGCSIAALKVLDRFGNGSREDVMRAFRWLMEFGSIYHIHIIKVCDGTACHVRKSMPVKEAMLKELGLSHKKHTTDDMMFTVETVSCLGACGLAPTLTVNDEVHPKMTPEKAVELLNELRGESV